MFKLQNHPFNYSKYVFSWGRNKKNFLKIILHAKKEGILRQNFFLGLDFLLFSKGAPRAPPPARIFKGYPLLYPKGQNAVSIRWRHNKSLQLQKKIILENNVTLSLHREKKLKVDVINWYDMILWINPAISWITGFNQNSS